MEEKKPMDMENIPDNTVTVKQTESVTKENTTELPYTYRWTYGEQTKFDSIDALLK